MTLLKPLFRLKSPAGARALLSVLIFHRVLSRADPLFPDEIDAGRFNVLCGWLASWFNVLPLDKAIAQMARGQLPARAACITFDDGYADNHDIALPILRQHGLPATFFVATGFLDGGRMWNDTIIESIRTCVKSELDLSDVGMGVLTLGTLDERKQAIATLIDRIKYQPVPERVALTERIAVLAGGSLPGGLMMTSDQVRAMHRAGMQIGAHTASHPILARLTAEHCKQEVQTSKLALEQILGERVGLFAYPNGKPGEDYLPETVDVVRQLGFDAAVSTQWGASQKGDDVFQIKRFTPWDKSRLRFGLRLLSNLNARH